MSTFWPCSELPAAHVDAFLDCLPAASGVAADWSAPGGLVRTNEALVVPTQVGIVFAVSCVCPFEHKQLNSGHTGGCMGAEGWVAARLPLA